MVKNSAAQRFLNGLNSVVIRGRITTSDTIAIQHIAISQPVAPDLSGVKRRGAGSAALGENQEPRNDAAESQTNPDSEITQPDDINSPADIEPPEVNEPNAPTPEIEPPEIEPPEIDGPQINEPPPSVEPPEIDPQPEK